MVNIARVRGTFELNDIDAINSCKAVFLIPSLLLSDEEVIVEAIIKASFELVFAAYHGTRTAAAPALFSETSLS